MRPGSSVQAEMFASKYIMRRHKVARRYAALGYQGGDLRLPLHARQRYIRHRYIFTWLGPVARAFFRPEDAAVLEYLEDDGQPVESTHFVPLRPMLLVNGASGSGARWSTNLPNFDPRRGER
mmetsp:Transcript_11262/g.34707  ORF Transcript_11262/g.34707 Transcript_11262/m.34707 type:complete len:122 (-) Transcript_11262:3298-3663(-)